MKYPRIPLVKKHKESFYLICSYTRTATELETHTQSSLGHSVSLQSPSTKPEQLNLNKETFECSIPNLTFK
jgi:hypothetical protein